MITTFRLSRPALSPKNAAKAYSGRKALTASANSYYTTQAIRERFIYCFCAVFYRLAVRNVRHFKASFRKPRGISRRGERRTLRRAQKHLGRVRLVIRQGVPVHDGASPDPGQLRPKRFEILSFSYRILSSFALPRQAIFPGFVRNRGRGFLKCDTAGKHRSGIKGSAEKVYRGNLWNSVN